ncbi:hypothetical protein TNCV_2737901 [Trichonephila clavipes]|nr:hypothetical protein TNCV_2737901 [Trichonephila clavipes]
MEWQSQLLNAKATSARANAELRDLQQACKNLENLLLSSQNKEEGKESTMDELLIKEKTFRRVTNPATAECNMSGCMEDTSLRIASFSYDRLDGPDRYT